MIIISVFIKWEKYIEDNNLDEYMIISFSGTSYNIKQNIDSDKYIIKTIESTSRYLRTVDFFSKKSQTDFKALKIYINNIKNILNIELVSKFENEGEVVMFNPFKSFTLYDTKKSNIQLGTEKIYQYTKIYLIIPDIKTLNEELCEKNNKGYRYNNYLDGPSINAENLVKKREIYKSFVNNNNNN